MVWARTIDKLNRLNWRNIYIYVQYMHGRYSSTSWLACNCPQKGRAEARRVFNQNGRAEARRDFYRWHLCDICVAHLFRNVADQLISILVSPHAHPNLAILVLPEAFDGSVVAHDAGEARI